MVAAHPFTFDERHAADPESARRWFVESKTDFLLGIIRRKLRDDDDVMDAYVYILEHLLADDCRRLRTYRESGSSFEAYLAVVATRRLLDWFRRQNGRRGIPTRVRAMGSLPRAVYQCVVLEGMTPDSALERLRHGPFANLEIADFADALSRIEPERFVNPLRPVMEPLAASGDAGAGSDLPDPAPGPGDIVIGHEARRRVGEAVARSHDAQARLAFWLSAEHGRKPAEIAAMLALAPEQVSEMLRGMRERVRREIPEANPPD